MTGSTNTYAINTTRGQEFTVERELEEMGLHPWVPKRLHSVYVKAKREAVWYDKPYVPKLMFCVIPAIYYRDVMRLKHVIGKPYELTKRGIEGTPGHYKSYEKNGAWVPEVPGLRQFKEAVQAEYADMERRKENSSYVCQYQPGQALLILDGAFGGHAASFEKVVRDAKSDYAKLRLRLNIMGKPATLDFEPDMVSTY